MIAIIFSRVCSVMFATPVSPSVSAGRSRCRMRTPMPASAAVMPAGRFMPNGSQPSHTAKIIKSSRPIQNAGVLARSSAYPRIRRSGRRSLKYPATMPSTSPRIPDSTHATHINANELPNFSATTSATGRLYFSEVPISPRTMHLFQNQRSIIPLQNSYRYLHASNHIFP